MKNTRKTLRTCLGLLAALVVIISVTDALALTFTAPITGINGDIGCSTCVTSGASLTSNAVVIGAGSQGVSTISAATTATHALMATAGAPAFRALLVYGHAIGSSA